MLKYFLSSLSCSCWNRAQHCSFTNDSHCQTDSLSEHRKKASSFLKPLSILFCLSCFTAPQYSLKSFRGTSEAFVKCICIQHVISWKMPSLCTCFFIYLKDNTYMCVYRHPDVLKCYIVPGLQLKHGATLCDYILYYHTYISWEKMYKLVVKIIISGMLKS